MEEQTLQNFEHEKKIVVVGSNGCGKTSLIDSFVSESPADITGTAPKEIRKLISFGREYVSVVLRETSIADACNRLLSYWGTSAVLVCFAFDNINSIQCVPKLINELRMLPQCPDLSVVGCKLDLKHKTPVSAEEWMQMEELIFPNRYLECSARTGEGVSHLVRVVGNALLSETVVEQFY